MTGRLLVGLMSGTSCDGVDAVLASFSGTPGAADFSARVLAHAQRSYSASFRGRLLRLPGARAPELARLDRELAERFAEAVSDALQLAGVARDDVRAVACAGHTAVHLPPDEHDEGGTLVLGDGDRIAALCGLPVLSELRAADRAVGGMGAPLVPFADACLLRDPERPVATLNLGGIANLTWIPPEGAPLAFDTGPGNMLLDALVHSRSNGEQTHDSGGALGLAGEPDLAWLQRTLATDDFVSAAPPKSTGRERYGASFLRTHAAALDALSLRDACATLAAYTVECVVHALRTHTPAPPAQLVVSGGGALNDCLMHGLRARLPEVLVADSEAALGVPVFAREALAMALLADASLLELPGNVPGVTGARRAVRLGKLSPGPRSWR
ncbi:MAG: anhydro-N-acetylmuramic acid kinase [Planctomycetota bacterium]|nr:MAG: anhydro-N-acetylmuramic acid kinase [Planctomycetota bacterium]